MVDTAEVRGRRSERTRIADAVARAADGRCVALVFEGEAGIGKTALMALTADAVLAAGFTTWQAKADEFERDRPFATLRSMVAPFDDLRPLGAEPARTWPSSAGIGLLEAPESSFQLVDHVLDLADRQLSRTPLAVLVDDAQWADDATVLALASLARRLDDRPLLLAIATRPVVGEHHPAALLSRLPTCERVPIGPLHDDEVLRVVEDRLGGPAPPDLLAEVARGRGNPFFVQALLDEWRRQGAEPATRREPAGAGPPAAVRLAVLRQIDDLGDDVRRVLETAAVLGGGFAVSVLADVAGLAVGELRRLLERALQARVLDDDGSRLRFHHDLAREILYDSVSPAVRRAMHLHIGRRMAALDVPAAQIAEHFIRGAEAGDAAAADVLRRAAADVGRVAPRAAVALLDRAAEILPAHHAGHRACLAELAQCCVFANEVERGARLADDLLATGVSRELELVVRNVRSQVFFLHGEARRAVDEFEAMLPLVDGDEREAVILADASISAMFAVDLDRARRFADEAVARATAHGEVVGRTLALGVRSWLTAFAGDLDAAVDQSARAVRSADQAEGLQAHRHVPCLFHAQALLWADRTTEARAVLRRGRQLSAELGMGWDEPMYQALLADERTRAGEWDDALAEAEAGIARAEEVGSRAADGWLHVHRARIMLFRGDVGGASAALDDAAASLGGGGGGQGADQLWHLRALCAWMSGDRATAHLVLRTLWHRLGELGVQLRRMELAPDVVRVAASQRDGDLVADVVASVERGAVMWPSPLSRSATHWARALAARDPHEAACAVTELRRRDHAVDLARCQADQAALLAEREAAPAGAMLAAASGRFAAWHASGLTRLHLDGLVAAEERSVADAPSGWDSLTPSERRIAELVGRGLANAEIAELLTISRRTVESHLYHAYPKLGLSSRVELAVHAAGRAGRVGR